MIPKILPYQLKDQINQIRENYFIPSLGTLTGNVLEIGCGTGENFNYFNDKCSVFAIDKKISVEHIGKIQHNTRCKLLIQKANAENLHYNDEFFDAVIGSFILCSVESLEGTLDEISRVLKKGGKLIFIEHIKSNDILIQAFQKLMTSIQFLLSKDCHLDRDPRIFFRNNKFQIVTEKVFSNSIEPYLFLEAIKK